MPGSPDPAATAELINGIVQTATKLLDGNRTQDAVEARVTALLEPYVREHRRSAPGEQQP